MAERYSSNTQGTATNNGPLASPGRTVLSVHTTVTTRRASVADIIVGSSGTPNDAQVEWLIQRMTALGTATTVTPRINDPGNPAAIFTSATAYTAEPTITASSSLVDEGVAQRSSFRWVAVPGYEFVLPATANNGLTITAIHASLTVAMTANAMWEE